MEAGDVSSRTAVADVVIPVEDTHGLDQERCREQGDGKVETKASDGRCRRAE